MSSVSLTPAAVVPAGLAVLVLSLPLVAAVPGVPEERARQIEADWLVQIASRGRRNKVARTRPVTTTQDAAGAVDGVKNGKWGFHTANQKAPWWQVDLGAVAELSRVVLYNRCDGTAGRFRRFSLLLSDDGKRWRQAHRYEGAVFYGKTDGKPLVASLAGNRGRFVRIQLPGTEYMHLDEVEVYGPADAKKNLALGKPADQSSVSQWSASHAPPVLPRGKRASDYPIAEAIRRGRLLAADLAAKGVDVRPHVRELDAAAAAAEALTDAAAGAAAEAVYFRVKWAVRRLAFANPLLDFDEVLLTKRVPGSYSHMSDQYYGWWSRPGGGIYILSGLKTPRPALRCLTEGFEGGSFLRPDLSGDARKILFAYCKHYPRVSRLGDKVTKSNIPEDAFYHVYEMNVDGSGRRRLTRGRYDDFDARYLPGGEIVFLSTRRGQFFQCGRASATATLEADLPDSYVRCGGGSSRPVAIYTLHVMNGEGGNLRAISAFENFEWTPSIAADGRILYARWDYVDRHNNAFMSLWATNPDGTNPQGVYGNFTRKPHCIFEARSIPNSNKLIFTASAHHAITAGSLVLLDPDVAQDDFAPITRLTPEVCFPEIEGWPATYYANPLPLSETYYLVAWSPNPIRREGGSNPLNSLGVYLFDVFGNLELIHRDAEFCTMYPMPLRPRKMPPVISASGNVAAKRHVPGAKEGRMLLVNVYDGLSGVAAGSVKRLRIVGVPAKVQPQMNRPNVGVTHEDPGKCVLGTVPIERDGSAYFRLPAGVNVLFQALDARGRAVQTMRTITYVQPGQTLSCIGCHEPRNAAPPTSQPLALLREASKLATGPEGTWPLRYDRLVQPVLDKHCVRCHRPGGEAKAVARLDLRPPKSYQALISHGGLQNIVRSRYASGRSAVGDTVAIASPLPGMFLGDKPHQGVRLDADAIERIVTWLDVYAQRLGSFSDAQEQDLRRLRREWAGLLIERPAGP